MVLLCEKWKGEHVVTCDVFSLCRQRIVYGDHAHLPADAAGSLAQGPAGSTTAEYYAQNSWDKTRLYLRESLYSRFPQTLRYAGLHLFGERVRGGSVPLAVQKNGWDEQFMQPREAVVAARCLELAKKGVTGLWVLALEQRQAGYKTRETRASVSWYS